MQDITQLAFGQLTPTDALIIELVRRKDLAAVDRTLHQTVVRIVWPGTPTIVDPKQYADVAAIAMKVLASASVELNRLAARRRTT
jgi:hypothetical protein